MLMHRAAVECRDIDVTASAYCCDQVGRQVRIIGHISRYAAAAASTENIVYLSANVHTAR